MCFNIKKDTCSPDSHVNRIVSTCYSEYSSFTQDQASYDVKWQNSMLNSSLSSIYSLNIKRAFEYIKSSDLNSFPYTAIVNTYYGGGYVFRMIKENKTFESVLTQLQILQELSWIDAQTSAIFLEFTLFNPNLNLFQHCFYIFEITSGGNFVTSSQLTPLHLFDLNDSALISFKVIIFLIYLAFVCILMAIEARELMKSKWFEYFRNAYNYFDLAIIAFSWAAFSMYLYRLYAANEIYTKLKQTDKNEFFINFQYAASCQTVFDFLMGLCVFFASFRFIKTLRLSKRIIIYILAFKRALNELLSFGLIFMIVWTSFVQVFYLLLNTESKGFSSIFASMYTCFQIVLGKFNSNAFYDSKSLMSVPLFVSYNVVIIFVMVNVLVSILVDEFGLAQRDEELSQVDVDVLRFLTEKISSLIPFIGKRNKIFGTNTVYVDFSKSFEFRVEDFLKKVKKVFTV